MYSSEACTSSRTTTLPASERCLRARCRLRRAPTRTWSIVPTTKVLSTPFLRPDSHACATAAPPCRSSSSSPTPCSAASCRPRNASFRPALPWARYVDHAPPSSAGGRWSSHVSNRANMALLVAIVGSATSTPPHPCRCARASAAASAASVLPSPIGASTISNRGSADAVSTSCTASCTGRGLAMPKRPVQ